MIRNPVLLYELDEIGWSISGKRRFVKVSVRAEEIVGTNTNVREVAAASAGDQDLASDFLVMFEDSDATSPLGRLRGAHESGGATADHDDIVGWQLLE